MKFKLKKHQSLNDTTIANISITNVHSENIMNVVDYSSIYDSNTISLSKDITSGIIDYSGVSRLITYNSFNEVIVTDEYKYNPIAGIKYPLYYSHVVSKNIYIPKTINKSIRKVIKVESEEELRITNIIPNTGKYILVKNSVVVTHILYLNVIGEPITTNYEVPNIHDCGTGEITIPAQFNKKGSIFIITYLLVDNKFMISESPNTLYRVNLEKIYKNSDNYFRMNILSTSLDPIQVKYISLENNGTAKEFNETTIGATTIAKVNNRPYIYSSNEINTFTMASYISPNTTPVKIIQLNDFVDMCTFKSDGRAASKIKIIQIPNVDYDKPWIIEISSAEIYVDHVLYSIKKPNTRLRYIKETPSIVNKYTISLNREKPIISIDNLNNISNMTITKNKTDKISINKVDREKGIVYLNTPILPTDKITTEYYIENNNIEYTDISFNPLYDNVDISKSLDQYIVVILLPPASSLPVNSTKQIFHMFIPKYTIIGITSPTFEYLDELVNGTENIRSQIKNIELLTLAPTDKLLILGAIYISNCLDEDGYILEDARTYGGGTLDLPDNFYDISTYDGERTDLNTILHIFIKQSIYDDLYQRVLIYDREVVQYKSDMNKMVELANHRTVEIINAKVEKFLPSGTEWEIKIG